MLVLSWPKIKKGLREKSSNEKKDEEGGKLPPNLDPMGTPTKKEKE